MKITHFKGTHFSWPPQNSFLPSGYLFNQKLFMWEIQFLPGSKYLIPDQDQFDWNKLCGISFTPSALITSAMVGWRYNPKEDVFECAAYCHENRETYMSPSLIKVRSNEKFVVSLDVNVKTHSYLFAFLSTDLAKVLGVHSVPFTHSKRVLRTVNAWFGGNKTAPETLCFLKKRVL